MKYTIEINDIFTKKTEKVSDVETITPDVIADFLKEYMNNERLKDTTEMIYNRYFKYDHRKMVIQVTIDHMVRFLNFEIKEK